MSNEVRRNEGTTVAEVGVQFRMCVFELTIFLDALAADGGWLTSAIIIW